MKQTPPAFIGVAGDDPKVSPVNSLLFYQALLSAGVAAELHVYEKGGHGMGVKRDLGAASSWTNRCEDWMRAHGWLGR